MKSKMKSKMKTSLVMFFVSVIVVSVVVWAKTTNSPNNAWRFLPASGNVSHYEVWKITPLDDTFVHLMDVPHEIGTDGYVSFEYISETDETYQLRIRAVDTLGNKGIWSLVSIDLNINRSMETGNILPVE